MEKLWREPTAKVCRCLILLWAGGAFLFPCRQYKTQVRKDRAQRCMHICRCAGYFRSLEAVRWNWWWRLLMDAKRLWEEPLARHTHTHTHASAADHIAIQTALSNVNANACMRACIFSDYHLIKRYKQRGATSSPQPAVTRSSLVPACFAAGHDYVNRIMFAHSLYLPPTAAAFWKSNMPALLCPLLAAKPCLYANYCVPNAWYLQA
jgi:hypothetical protein